MLIVVLPFVLFGGKSLASTTIIFLINVTLVVALQTFVGNSGIMSFGHVTFMGVGAYVTAWLTIPPAIKSDQLPELPTFLAEAQWGFLPSVLAAAVVSGLFAAIVGIVLVRMTVNAMVMATLALLLVMYSVWLNWSTLTRGSTGVFGVPRDITPFLAIAGAVVFIFIARLFKATRIGLQLRASREDELSSSALGINVRLVRYVAWVFSAAMMGAAGSLWSFNIIAFDPGQFSFAITFALLAMLILGGKESVLGAVVGAAIIGLVTELFSRVEQGVSVLGIELPRITGTVQFVIALLIIFALIWRPEGIVGRREIEDFIPPLASWLRRSQEKSEDAVPQKRTQSSETTSQESSGEFVLEGKNLAKSFSGVKALGGVDIEVKRGEILGLIGPNGSGKSTLLNLISGLTDLDSGQVLIEGLDVTGLPSHIVAQHGLARTFQNIRIFHHLLVAENVFAPPRTTSESGHLSLKQLGLLDVRFMEANTLSYGMQRRLEIARAMGTQPSVVLLDEPAAGMNHVESDVLLSDIRSLAKHHGCGVIIIDHDLRLIMRLCDRIQVLEAGNTIAVGTPAEVSSNAAVLAAYLGDAPTEIDNGPHGKISITTKDD
jgi:branched-chain amino acid transport system permease protein